MTTTGELETVPELVHLGFDPLEEVMSWARFGQLLADRHTQLKTLLMDQKFVAGIGNIYSDEILFAAGLRYDRGSDSLSAQEIRRLYRAMVETLSEAVKYRGRPWPTSSTVTSSARPVTTRVNTRSTTARAAPVGAVGIRSSG